MNGRSLGVLGGTFDPIHYGHLDAAGAACAALALDEVLFIPSHDPPHRPVDPLATPFHRFAMAALAVSGCDRYRVSDMELLRDGASYTVDTLRALHEQGWAASQLFFILGADAFAEVATWRDYPRVLDGANFVVVARRGTTPEEAVARNPELSARTSIILLNADTRDVSSTLIRQRLRAGQPIDDLVPAAVARHILAHHLYGAVGRLHGEDEHAGR
ncbi:MAG: nicotinate-nucleotide adenylyltransferase [Vicinamibacterales bacterium]